MTAFSDHVVIEEALRLIIAIARDERGALLAGESFFHFAGDPFLEIDEAVVEQRLRRGEIGVELGGREFEQGERRRRSLRARAGFADPARASRRQADRLLEHVGPRRPHRRNRAHRRDLLQAALDHAVEFRRGDIAAVGVRADRERLGFELRQRRNIAAPQIGAPRGFVLAHRRIGCKRRATAGERRLLDQRFLLGQRAIDTIDLLFKQHVAAPFLDRVEPRIVGRLEFLERAHQRIRAASRRGFGFFPHVSLLKQRG